MYTCPFCKLVSHHPKDAQERYCGACRRFEADAPATAGLWWWVLEGRAVRPVADRIAWGQWFNSHHANRSVGVDHIVGADGRDVVVSTVFTGVNMAFCFGEPPLLFETMVFDHTGCAVDVPVECDVRSSTFDEAEAMHRRVTDLMRVLLGAPGVVSDGR